MNIEALIGQEVMIRNNKRRGIISSINNNVVTISIYETKRHFEFPSAFINELILKDPELQKAVENEGSEKKFDNVKQKYLYALKKEIAYIKTSGKKRNHAVDGRLLQSNGAVYIYFFETDTDYHYPDGTKAQIIYNNTTL